MKTSHLSRPLGQVCAVGLATLMLATLAQAKPDDKEPHWRAWRSDNEIDKIDKIDKRGGPSVPALPEANAGLVLIPIVGAVLFFSTRRLWRSAPQAGVDQSAR